MYAVAIHKVKQTLFGLSIMILQASKKKTGDNYVYDKY